MKVRVRACLSLFLKIFFPPLASFPPLGGIIPPNLFSVKFLNCLRYCVVLFYRALEVGV